MSYEAIPFPTGQTSAQLYNWATSTAVALRRILQDVTGGSDVDLSQLASDVATLQAQTASLQEQIDNQPADSFTPQRAFELDLVTRADEVLGSLTGERARQKTQREQNADATILAAIQAKKASTGVSTEIRVRAEQDLSLAQRLDSVTADLGVTNGSITTLTQAVADGDSSLGARIDNVSSTVAGNTASIETVQESVDGIVTHFAIVLNAQGEQVGWFKLDGSQTGTSADFNVDHFRIGKAGTTGGDAVYAFGIDVVDGVAKIALRGDVIADGAISARTIAAGAVTADKISANNLSAISADLGTAVAGTIQDLAVSPNVIFDVPNQKWYRTDGKAVIDLAAGTMLFAP